MMMLQTATVLSLIALLNPAPSAHAHGFGGNFEFASEAEESTYQTEAAREAEILEKKLLDSAAQSCRYVSGITTSAPAKKVALTFDDGPDATATAYVLDILKKYNIRATFFMVGQHARALPSLVKRVAEDGHLIVASHSWSHPNFHELSQESQKAQIIQTENVLSAFSTPKFFRYPYGNSTCYSNDLLRSRGYKIVGWHVDSCDWAYDTASGTLTTKQARICEVSAKNTSNFVGHVVDSIRKQNGGIVLMHEVHHRTIRQLEKIIQKLIAEGYDFGSIDEPGFERSLR